MKKTTRKTPSKKAKVRPKKAISGKRRSPVAKDALGNRFMLESILENLTDGVVIVDSNGIVQYASPKVQKLLTTEQSELIGKNFGDYLNVEELKAAMDLFRKGLHAPGSVQAGSFLVKGSDGTVTHLDAIGKCIRDKKGALCYISTIHDATPRKKAEEALLESEQRYKILTENAHDMIFIVDRDGKVNYVNKFGASEFQTIPEKMIGKNIAELFPPEHAKRQLANIRKAYDTRSPVYVEVQTRFPKGIMYLDSWLVPFADLSGKVTAVFGISRDTTARRLAEEEARILAKEAQNERNRAQIYFDYLAHDVANMASPILTYSDTILKSEEISESVRNYIQKIAAQSERLASFIMNFRILAEAQKVQSSNVEPVDLREVLEDAEKAIEKSSCRLSIDIHLDAKHSQKPMLIPGGKFVRHAITSIFCHFSRIASMIKTEDKVSSYVTSAVNGDHQPVWRISIEFPGVNLPKGMIDALSDFRFAHKERNPQVPSDEMFGAIIIHHFGGKLSAEYMDKFNPPKGFIATIDMPKC